MSMSMHVVGYRQPDELWRQMLAIWDACRVAHIDPPPAVLKFFDSSYPDKAGIEVELLDAAYRWSDDGRDGFDVNVTQLPAGLTIVRFYCSW